MRIMSNNTHNAVIAAAISFIGTLILNLFSNDFEDAAAAGFKIAALVGLGVYLIGLIGEGVRFIKKRNKKASKRGNRREMKKKDSD